MVRPFAISDLSSTLEGLGHAHESTTTAIVVSRCAERRVACAGLNNVRHLRWRFVEDVADTASDRPCVACPADRSTMFELSFGEDLVLSLETKIGRWLVQVVVEVAVVS